MKLFTKGYSRELIVSSRIVFFKSLPKIPFLGKCGLRASKCFVQNETRYKVVFGVQRGADSEFDSCFSNFVPKIPFLGKFVTKTPSALFKMKLGTKEYSGVLILNSTITFSNSVPRIILNLVPKNLVLYLKWNSVQRVFGGADSEIGSCFLNSVPS